MKAEKTIPQLVAYLKKCSDAYYNGNQLITDKQFDNLVDELKERDPKNAFLKEVGASVPKSEKVKLKLTMGSLDKVKPDTVSRWIEGKELEVSEKLDGFSLQLVVGSKLGLYTRGDGHFGRDISAIIPFLNLPNDLPKGIVVRLEGIVGKQDFKDDFSVTFKNERNFLSSIFNSQKVNKKAASRIKLVALELSSHPTLKPSEQKKKLKSYGFEVPYSKVLTRPTKELLDTIYDQRMSSCKYHMDGLVLTINEPYRISSTRLRPLYAVAYKQEREGASAKVKVLDVEWNPSKGGLLKPTVIIEPTELSGVTIQRVTGHNAYTIQMHGIGKGAIIEIVRSGDVIPYIKRVVKEVKPQMPANYTWVSDYEIKTTDTDHAKAIMVRKMVYFTSVMGIEGVKEGVLSMLYDAGINTIGKLVNVKKAKLLNIEGIQDKTATRIVQNIKEAMETCTGSLLAAALNAFGQGIGYKKLLLLEEALPNFIEEPTATALDRKRLIAKISKIHGFSEATAEKIAENLHKLVSWIEKNNVVLAEPELIEEVSNKLVGIRVAFTGFRSKELETIILENGGTLSSGKCDILLAKDPNASSSKISAAREQNVPVLTQEQFVKRYKL